MIETRAESSKFSPSLLQIRTNHLFYLKIPVSQVLSLAPAVDYDLGIIVSCFALAFRKGLRPDVLEDVGTLGSDAFRSGHGVCQGQKGLGI